MRNDRTWGRGSVFLVLFLWVILPALVQAQQVGLEEIQARLEKLESENLKLRKELDKVKAQAQPEPGEPPGVAITPQGVQKIVGDYLKEQDDKKKKAEEDKKKEEAAKKQQTEEQGVAVGSSLRMSASWKDGLLLQGENKDFSLHLGGRFDDQWVFFNQPQALKAPGPLGVGNMQDGTFFRRARFRMDGTAYEVWEWSVEVNFENINLVTFQGLWLGLNQIPIIGTLRVGNNRVPQGLEAYTNENYNTFMERACPFDTFLQNFNPGVLVENHVLDDRVTWQALFHRIPAAGIPPTGFSGTNAGNNANSGADFGNGEYAGTGRITGLPFYEAEGRCLVHLGANYQFRKAKFDPASGVNVVIFRSRPEIFPGNGFVGDNTRFLDTGRIQTDYVQTVGAEFATVLGPLSLQSEYWLVDVHDARFPVGATSRPVGSPHFQGFYAQASYFLTGENRPYDRRTGRFDRIRPFTNFWLVHTDDGASAGWGAWELAVRYSMVNLNDSPIVLGTGGQLSEYTVGLNWYLNPNMRVQWNYVRANRNVAAPLASGNVDEFGMNFHIDF